MTSAAAAIKPAVLRNAAGEPPLGVGGLAFRDDQGEIFHHENPRYRTPLTTLGVLELEDGKWLAYPFRLDGEQFDDREKALAAACNALVSKAMAYRDAADGEGTKWTADYANAVIDWASGLKPTVLGMGNAAENKRRKEVAFSDPVVKALNEAHGARKEYPAGHAISMTNPIINGEMKTVGTCQCGHVFQYRWGSYETMNAAIEAHWQSFDHLPNKVDGRGNPISAEEPAAGSQPATAGAGKKRSRRGAPKADKVQGLVDAALIEAAPADASCAGGAVSPESDVLQALRDIDAGREISGEMARHLVGEGLAHATAKSMVLTDAGRAMIPDGYLAGITAKISDVADDAVVPQLPRPEPAPHAPIHPTGAGSPFYGPHERVSLVERGIGMDEPIDAAFLEARFNGVDAPIGAPSDDDDLAIDWPNYDTFIEDKIITAPIDGVEVTARDVSPLLKPHQRDLVVWAVQGGQRAIFAAFGLGKTIMQIEIVRLITQRVEGNGLIVVPLGVRQEFFHDADMLGLDFKFIRSDAEITDANRLYLTNYESVREGKIHPDRFVVASLDESAVLRSYGSKTFQEFLPLFAKTRYRFVATATPSPNRFKELIHYSAFLGVMDSGQALTRFFQRDSEKAGNLTLYPHKTEEFWMWVHSWASFLQTPSDLGHPDEGYSLPPLNVVYEEVPSNHGLAGAERDGQRLLFRNAAVGLQDASRERRDTLDARIERLGAILNGYRNQSGIPAPILPGEQGPAAAAATDAQQERLSEEQGSLRGAQQALEAGKPGAVQGGDESLPAEECREAEGPQRDLVSEQQGMGHAAAAAPETSELRPDDGSVRGDAGGSRRKVRGVRNDADASEQQRADGNDGGSLPQDGQGARASVPALQPGDRTLLRRPGPAHAGSGLSDQIIIWVDLNAEQEAVERLLDKLGISYSSLYGNQDIEEREKLLGDWRAGRTSVFLSKPIMYGAGVNLQQCHTMVFLGISYKFHDLIQAVHRIWRFLQLKACDVHILHSEAEREILTVLKQKWAQHDEMTAAMSAIIRSHGLDVLPMRDAMARSIGVKRVEVKGEKFTAINNDCVAECRAWPENSVDQIVTSIPFSNHYEYSPSYRDFGHTDDNGHFWSQMDFLTCELHRMIKPGRLACIHVKDRVLFGAVTGEGVPTISPFHAEAIMHYRAHGFQYMGMITVVTDVVRENNQTYRLGWSENAKDGTKMGVGSPEYVLLFRKRQSDRSRGYADAPVEKSKEVYTRARWQVDAHGYWRSSGNRHLTPEEFALLGPGDLARLFAKTSAERVYDFEAHVKIGEALERLGSLPATFMSIAPGSHHPDVWHDVNRMRTLNMMQQKKGQEQHLCPLQFDIVDRLIERYSNEGELIFDPFGGLMTVPYRALLKGRRGAGCELSATYFLDGVKYLQAAEEKMATPALFDLAAFDSANTPPPSDRLDGGGE